MLIDMINKRATMLANPTRYSTLWDEQQQTDFDCVLAYFNTANSRNWAKFEAGNSELPTTLAWSRIIFIQHIPTRSNPQWNRLHNSHLASGIQNTLPELPLRLSQLVFFVFLVILAYCDCLFSLLLLFPPFLSAWRRKNLSYRQVLFFMRLL